jgi:histidyl-tRNA synthetase
MTGPDIDAEQLLMCSRLWDDLGLTGMRLHINSLGSSDERTAFRVELVTFLRKHAAELDEDSRRRLETNPLRVLDSKNPQMQEIIEAAPKLMTFLGGASLGHFEGVQAVLKDAGIPYEINSRLVRGLDYYNLTVFEWVTDRLGAQGTVCGGGRYDGLFGQIGGKPTPACGWAIGIERLLSLIADEGRKSEFACPDVYVVNQGEVAARYAFTVAERLRDSGLSVIQHCGGGSFKSQMKKADASRALLAVIVGDDEAANAEVSIKPLREESEQARISIAQAPQWISDFLYSESE